MPCPSYIVNLKHVSFLGGYKDGQKIAKDIVGLIEKPTKLDRYRLLSIKGRPLSKDKEDYICIYDEYQQKYIREFSLFFDNRYVGVLNDGTVFNAKNHNSISDISGFFSIDGNGFIKIKKENNKIEIEFLDSSEEDFLKFFRLSSIKPEEVQGYSIRSIKRYCKVTLLEDEDVLILNCELEYDLEEMVPRRFSDAEVHYRTMLDIPLPEGYDEAIRTPSIRHEKIKGESLSIKPLKIFLKSLDKEIFAHTEYFSGCRMET